MSKCLFCNSNGPFLRPEHIIPEALGCDDLVLLNEVCDKCNQFFGSKIENFVLGKTPLAFWRTYLGIKTKKGKLPHVELSQPQKQKGRFPSIHDHHDNFVGFTCHKDYSDSVDIGDSQIMQEIVYGKRNQFTFVFTPEVIFNMGRFLLKVGLELVCLSDSVRARADDFNQARLYARFGDFKDLWPIFHFQSGSIKDLKITRIESEGIFEEVFCYNFRLLDFKNKYLLSELKIGIDTWVVCLNDPSTNINDLSAFSKKLNLIWYGPHEIR